MKDYKVASVNGKKLAKGNLKIEFDATLEKDYKEKWEGNFFYKFFRGVHDKYIAGSHFAKLGDEVKNECIDCIDQIKDYLDMVKER